MITLFKKFITKNEELEKENEKLKEQLDKELQWHRSTDKIDTINHEYVSKLKAENEKLKEEKQSLIKDWEEKKNLAYEIACKNEKLKQVLKEIQQTAHESFLQGKMISSGWLCQKIDEEMTQ